MKLKNIIFAGAMVALMGSQSALADSVTVTANYLGSARLGNTVGVGYKSGDIFPHPSDPFSSSVLIGGDSFNVDAPKAGLYGLPNGPFDAWCVDIWHWLHSPSTFTIDDTPTLASSLGVNGAARVSALTKLANLYYGSLNTQEESAAFQLAVWAITYGATNAQGYYSVNDTDTGNNFHVDSVTAGSDWGNMANYWLTHLNTQATSSYDIIYLRDATNTATQDMVVFKMSAGSTVPEPGTIALLGIGLLAVSLSHRRRR